MAEVNEVISEQYEIGGLATGSPSFYERLGWERWTGTTWVDRDGDRERTESEDGGIMVLRTPGCAELDLRDDIVCDWREGDVW